MSDTEYHFKKVCFSAVDEAWDDLIRQIKEGNPETYKEDYIAQSADGCVPIYTNELYDLVEFLDEHWDEAKVSMSLDDAIRYAVYLKASDYCFERYAELGGSDMLDRIQEAFSCVKAAMDHVSIVDFQEAVKNYPEECEALGITADMPTTPKKELKP